MKSTSAFFAVWSVTVVLSPVFASCPQEQESVNRASVMLQEAQPCHASERVVLVQNDDMPTASHPQKQVNTYQEQRLSQPNGLGFGLLIGELAGVQIFYDHTFDLRSQLHTQLGYKIVETGYLIYPYTSSDVWVVVTQLSAVVTYRRFISPNLGFYYGGGLGIAQNELKYTDISAHRYTDYKASGRGMFALAEIGWQGIKSYYFHVGFQPGIYLSYDDDYDVSKVKNDPDHRQAANEKWNDSKQLSQLELGFGWFF